MVSIHRLIAKKAKASNSGAFQYRDEVYRYIFARIDHAEEAEDLAMEVVHAASGVTGEYLKTYMIGIARHKVADHFRRKAIRRSSEVGECETTLDNADQFLAVQAVLGQLPENYQECLVLKYICGFSVDEVAEMLAQSKSAVDSTLQRAKKAFATEWNRLNGEEHE